MSRLLASLDVGGTLGQADGPSLASILAAASPLPSAEARRVMRETLHNQPKITTTVVINVCEALRIPTTAFPTEVAPTPLRLYAGVREALASMAHHATLATLSNVTCMEAGTEQILSLLRPWVVDHFPSCQIGYAKPDPAAFHHVASALGTVTENMVHIGDDWTCDIIGARSAGATAIWISNGRAGPVTEGLDAPGVLIAENLAAAGRHLATIARRRQNERL